MMYYHARPIELCCRDKIYGKNEDQSLYRSANFWLSKYSGFVNPLWVSNSRDALCKYSNDSAHVLFGFSSMHGFPVSYKPWMYILSRLLMLDTTDVNFMDGIVEDMFRSDLADEVKNEWVFTYNWNGCVDLRHFLRKNIFVRTDQFALESLDLRQAATIICKEQVHRTVLVRKQFNPKIIKVSSYRTLRRA